MERLTVHSTKGLKLRKGKKFVELLSDKSLTLQALNQLACYEDEIESGELIARDKVMEKIESVIDELVEIGFMDSQCQVVGCHKPDKIQCGDGICIEENRKIWKGKILEALK